MRSPIKNISDTALMVAQFRAMESARPDAVFRDPFAQALVGNQGKAILKTIPGSQRNAWTFIVRTSVIDRWVLAVTKTAPTRVVNLACGLDTRPYRLPLPARTEWIEVDLPDLIAQKKKFFRGKTANCRLQSLAIDLQNEKSRRDFFRALDRRPTRTLFITEGYLLYLTAPEVHALAEELGALKCAKFWLTDLLSSAVLKPIQNQWNRKMRAAGCPIQFAPEGGAKYFESFGWTEEKFLNYLDEAKKLKRESPNAKSWNRPKKSEAARRRARQLRLGGIALLTPTRTPRRK